jgi:hypothetical protein
MRYRVALPLAVDRIDRTPHAKQSASSGEQNAQI